MLREVRELVKEREEKFTQPFLPVGAEQDAALGEDVCAICLGEAADMPCVKLAQTCGHCFHEECLQRDIRNAMMNGRPSICPTCRTECPGGFGIYLLSATRTSLQGIPTVCVNSSDETNRVKAVFSLFFVLKDVCTQTRSPEPGKQVECFAQKF